jgi:hypothetical protein
VVKSNLLEKDIGFDFVCTKRNLNSPKQGTKERHLNFHSPFNRKVPSNLGCIYEQVRHWIPVTNWMLPSTVSFSMKPLSVDGSTLATATEVPRFKGQLAPHGDQTTDVNPTAEGTL